MEQLQKSRGVNFKAEEKAALINIIAQYSEIIENKKTDGSTIKDKELAWEEVKNDFNSIAIVTKRTTKQIKGFYENLKRRAKKKNTEDKLNLFKTGGGTPVKSTLDDAEVQLLSILKDRVEPLQNEFDSDASLHKQLDSSTSSDVCMFLDQSVIEIELEEGMEQDALSEPENASINVSDTVPVNLQAHSEITRKNQWKSRNRPNISKCKRSEAAEAREKVSELAKARQELTNLEMEQLREKHSIHMQFMKLRMENEQLKKEALMLKIKHYKHKLSDCEKGENNYNCKQ